MAAVTLKAECRLRSAMQGLQLLPGGEVDLGVVFLEPGAVVTGRVFDAVGAEPAAGCLAKLRAMIRASSGQLLLDAGVEDLIAFSPLDTRGGLPQRTRGGIP